MGRDQGKVFLRLQEGGGFNDFVMAVDTRKTIFIIFYIAHNSSAKATKDSQEGVISITVKSDKLISVPGPDETVPSRPMDGSTLKRNVTAQSCKGTPGSQYISDLLGQLVHFLELPHSALNSVGKSLRNSQGHGFPLLFRLSSVDMYRILLPRPLQRLKRLTSAEFLLRECQTVKSLYLVLDFELRSRLASRRFGLP